MFRSLKIFVAVSALVLLAGSPLYTRTMEKKDSTLAQKKIIEPCTQQRVHRVGDVNFCVTNWGLLGSQMRDYWESVGGCFNPAYPNEYPDAPSFEFPAGSDLEYLFQGAVWIGAVVEGETLVSVGADGWEHVYEMFPEEEPEGCIKEKSILLWTPNCNPADTFGAISDQDVIAEYTDTSTILPLPDPNDGRPHKPLNIKVIQKSYSWSGAGFDRFIITDYYIVNLGFPNLDSVYVGFYFDGDVYHMSTGPIGYLDDISGFKSYYISSTDETSEVNLVWLADNNGDPYKGNWDYRSVRGASAMMVLDTPNPALKYSFNWWLSYGYAPFTLDFGPQKQVNWDKWIAKYGAWCSGEGQTGTPCGDRAKYFLMSNGEIDYDQIYACIDHTSEGWLPRPDSCFTFANGYDARYLLSFGPFELLSQDTLHFVMALIGGDSFHVYTNNPIDPYNPDSFYNKLNFSDLAQKAIRAESLYKSGYTYITPPKPFNLEAKYIAEGEVLLTWTKVEKGFVTGYNIYRGIQSGVYSDTQFYAQPADSICYIDSGLVVGQIYYYAVSALNSLGESGKSEEVRIVVGAPQVIPEGVKVSDLGDGQSLHLEWHILPDTSVTGFRVHYGTTSGSYTLVADAGYTFSYDLSGLNQNTTYYIALSAYNQALIEGLKSDEVTGIPRSAPLKPTGFQALAGNKRVDLFWNVNLEEDLAGYRIYRRRLFGEPKHLLVFVPAPDTFFSDTSMVFNDSSYNYFLSAVDRDSNESQQAASFCIPGVAQIGDLYFWLYDYVFGWGNMDFIPNPGEFLTLGFRILNSGSSSLLNPKAIANTDDPCIYKAYIESDTLYGETAAPDYYARFDYHPVRGGRYWQRYLVMIRSDCPSGDTVYIPIDFYDNLETYVGSDTIAFQVVGADSTPPRVIQVDCHPQVSTGIDTIMALIEDGADMKEAFALIKNSLNDSLVASVPLQDEGLSGDLKAGDRIFSGVYSGTDTGDFYVDVSATDIYDNSLVSNKLSGFSTRTFQHNNSILFYYRYGSGDFTQWLLSGNCPWQSVFILQTPSNGAWDSALDSLSVGYDFWDEFYRGEIPSGVLLSYAPEDEVIYVDDYGDLSGSSQNSLIDFLSSYGKLIISSGWMGMYLDTTIFYQDYLHTDLASQWGHFSSGDGVLGLPQGQIFSGDFFRFAQGYPNTFYEEVDPIAPAVTVLKYHSNVYNSSGSAGIKYVNPGPIDSSRVLYYAFNWAKLSEGERPRLLQKSLSWLITAVKEEDIANLNLPEKFELSQNYPNPFNPNTVIEYALPQATSVKLVIYNILGQKVRVLADEYQQAGYKRILWDGKNSSGQMVSSGIYFYRLEAGDLKLTRRMILLK